MSMELIFKQTSMLMVVGDGHRQTFNLNPSGDKDDKSKQGFWKVAEVRRLMNMCLRRGGC